MVGNEVPYFLIYFSRDYRFSIYTLEILRDLQASYGQYRKERNIGNYTNGEIIQEVFETLKI